MPDVPEVPEVPEVPDVPDDPLEPLAPNKVQLTECNPSPVIVLVEAVIKFTEKLNIPVKKKGGESGPVV